MGGGGLRVEGVKLRLCVLFACVKLPFSFLFCHHKRVKAGGWAVVPASQPGVGLFIYYPKWKLSSIFAYMQVYGFVFRPLSWRVMVAGCGWLVEGAYGCPCKLA